MFMRVVFPVPFSPRRAWIFPGSISRSMRSLARTPGNLFVILSIRITVWAINFPEGIFPLLSRAFLGRGQEVVRGNRRERGELDFSSLLQRHRRCHGRGRAVV